MIDLPTEINQTLYLVFVVLYAAAGLGFVVRKKFYQPLPIQDPVIEEV